MEQGPTAKRKMSYQEAMTFAQEHRFEFLKAKIWTLENHIVTLIAEKFGPDNPRTKEFEKKLKKLKELTINNLIALGKETLGNNYDIFADYSLDEESLKNFCQRKNIELIP